jgi:hypothetical protein
MLAVEEAIVEKLRTAGPCCFHEVLTGLPNFSWGQIFVAVHRMSRDGRVFLRNGYSTYQISLSWWPTEVSSVTSGTAGIDRAESPVQTHPPPYACSATMTQSEVKGSAPKRGSGLYSFESIWQSPCPVKGAFPSVRLLTRTYARWPSLLACRTSCTISRLMSGRHPHSLDTPTRFMVVRTGIFPLSLGKALVPQIPRAAYSGQ